MPRCHWGFGDSETGRWWPRSWMVSSPLRDVTGQSAKQEADGGQLDEVLDGLHLALVVLGQSPGPIQPSEATFHYPSTRLHLEAMGAWLALHDLQLPAGLLLAPVGQLLPTVRRIGPDLLEPGHQRGQS